MYIIYIYICIIMFIYVLSSCGKCSERFFCVFDISVFFSVFHLWGSLTGPFFLRFPLRFFSVFHPGAPGTLGPWTLLRTPKFFNLSGSIYPHENPTQTYRFWHIWALNVPGQVWPSTARALLDRFFSVFHSVFFPFSVKNALSVFHLKNGKKNGKVKNGKKMLSAFSTRTNYIY